jgi:hypothetical protein
VIALETTQTSRWSALALQQHNLMGDTEQGRLLGIKMGKLGSPEERAWEWILPWKDKLKTRQKCAKEQKALVERPDRQPERVAWVWYVSSSEKQCGIAIFPVLWTAYSAMWSWESEHMGVLLSSQRIRLKLLSPASFPNWSPQFGKARNLLFLTL